MSCMAGPTTQSLVVWYSVQLVTYLTTRAAHGIGEIRSTTCPWEKRQRDARAFDWPVLLTNERAERVYHADLPTHHGYLLIRGNFRPAGRIEFGLLAGQDNG